MGSIIIAATIIVLIILFIIDKKPKKTNYTSPRNPFIRYQKAEPKRIPNRDKKLEYEPAPSSYPPKKSINSSKDFRYLITLLNGDEAAAIRLVQNIEKVYPEKHTQWAIDKAISDILRDRR